MENLNTLEKLNAFKIAFEEHQQKIKELKASIQKDFKDKLTPVFKDIFSKYLEIENLNWTQYTPYFNDGDTCEFHFNGLRVKLNPKHVTSKDIYNDYKEGFDVSFYKYYFDKNILGEEVSYFNNISADMFENLSKLENILKSVEDELKDIFGDHAEIIITPEKIEVKDYDHD